MEVLQNQVHYNVITCKSAKRSTITLNDFPLVLESLLVLQAYAVEVNTNAINAYLNIFFMLTS